MYTRTVDEIKVRRVCVDDDDKIKAYENKLAKMSRYKRYAYRCCGMSSANHMEFQKREIEMMKREMAKIRFGQND